MPLFTRILIETADPKLKTMSVAALSAKARRLRQNLDNHRLSHSAGVNPRTMKIAGELDAVNRELELRRQGRVQPPSRVSTLPKPGDKTTGFGDPRNDAPRPQTYGQPGTWTGD